MSLDRADVLGTIQSLSQSYPPSVGNSPALYGLDLWANFWISCLAFTIVFRTLSLMFRDVRPLQDYVTTLRFRNVMVYLSGFMIAMPAAMISMVWNNVQPETMAHLMTFQKVMSFGRVAPFMLSIYASYLMFVWFLESKPIRIVRAAMERAGLVKPRRPVPCTSLKPISVDTRGIHPEPPVQVMLSVGTGLIAIILAATKWYQFH